MPRFSRKFLRKLYSFSHSFANNFRVAKCENQPWLLLFFHISCFFLLTMQKYCHRWLRHLDPKKWNFSLLISDTNYLLIVFFCKDWQRCAEQRFAATPGAARRGKRFHSLTIQVGVRCKVVYLGWPIAPSYMSPNARGGGELLGLSQWVQLYTGAQINCGDLTPYLTYAVSRRLKGLSHEMFGFCMFRQFRHRNICGDC